MSSASSDDYPEFSLSKGRFDMSTFGGRFSHFSNLIDPRTLMPSVFFGMNLEKAREVVRTAKKAQGGDEAAKAEISKYSNKELWTARKIKESAVHPDTDEIIPQPFRMAGFVPYGTPVVAGMILTSHSYLGTIVFQILNQSHNAMINYSNRNATAATTLGDLAQGYMGAVGTSVGVALALERLIERLPSTIAPSTRNLITKLVPFPAVATANIANLVLMRRRELVDGIEVTLPDGTVVGKSAAAAKQAIFETGITRVALPVPLFFLPPLIMSSLEKNILKNASRAVTVSANVGIVAGVFALGLPAALALFDQYGTIKVEKLEDSLRAKLEKMGVNASELTYNKGL